MNNTITKEQVKKIADIAGLTLTTKESDSLVGELSSTVDYINVLSLLDVKLTPPTFQTNNLHNILREDVIEPSLTSDQALANAPKAYKGFFATLPIFKKNSE